MYVYLLCIHVSVYTMAIHTVDTMATPCVSTLDTHSSMGTAQHHIPVVHRGIGQGAAERRDMLVSGGRAQP